MVKKELVFHNKYDNEQAEEMEETVWVPLQYQT